MKINFDKHNGLIPAVIQDYRTGKVLMLGFMNHEAFDKTLKEGKVTFYSRTKKSLWTKGETSGNYLLVKDIIEDCDEDTLLIKADPMGPVCHTGADTCFNENNRVPENFIGHLTRIIRERHQNPSEKSYTSSLFEEGINRIARKVGEEAIELVIEAKDDHRELFLNEAADLFFHYLVLLEVKGHTFDDVVEILKDRHK